MSPFVGRIDDISMDGLTLIQDIADIFAIHEIETEIIAASVRTRCILFNVLKQVLILQLFHLKYSCKL